MTDEPNPTEAERWRAAARTQAALLCMRCDDLSGAEGHLAYAVHHLQEAQRLKENQEGVPS